MQGFLDSPRGGLKQSDIEGLLFSDSSVEIEQGAYWLDSNFTQIGNLTPYMQSGCVVNYDNTAQIQATCTITLQSDCPFNAVTDFVQPYMRMTNDRGVTAEFHLGVFTLQSPPYNLNTPLGVQTFSGYDLNYLLTMPMPDSRVVYQGQNILAQVMELIAESVPGAGVSYIDSSSTASGNIAWPLGGDGGGTAVSYQDAINQLLNNIGYENIWFDWEGSARLMPYETPSTRTVEHAFDLTSENNTVSVERTVEQDLFDVPNQWIFIMNDISAAPQEGVTQFTYTDSDASNPGSAYNRKRVRTSINYVTAADYASMVALAKKQITADLTPAETYTFSTFPCPLAWWSDIITIRDPNFVQVPPLYQDSRTLNVMSWSLPLDGSSDMSWTANTATV